MLYNFIIERNAMRFEHPNLHVSFFIIIIIKYYNINSPVNFFFILCYSKYPHKHIQMFQII